MLAAVMSLTACYRASSYSGDGRLTDYGWWELEGNRFVLDLGPVDLSVPSRHSYRLSNLPNAEFTAGVEIVEAEPNLIGSARPAHPSVVRLELTTSNNEVAIIEEGPLDIWVWSYGVGGMESYLYRRGEAKEVPLGGGTTTSERLGVKAAKGWGSYFTPEESTTYFLTFEVLDSRSETKRPARLVLYGS